MFIFWHFIVLIAISRYELETFAASNMSRAGKPVELVISRRSKPIKKKTPKGKQVKKPKTETKTRQDGESGGQKARVQVAVKEKEKNQVAETPKSCAAQKKRCARISDVHVCEKCIVADPFAIDLREIAAKQGAQLDPWTIVDYTRSYYFNKMAKEKETKEKEEEKEEKEEEMSDDDPSDQDDEEKEQDDEDEAKVEKQEPGNETKESKKCYAVTFKGQFNSDANQFGIFKNECKKPIVCFTWERAQRVKEETINKYLDKFYDNLVEGRDKIDFTNSIRPEYNSWARKTQFEIRYKYFPGACYCATFDTKDEANDFAKLLNTVQKGEAIRNRFWIRRVCQSYLRLKMRITRGVVLA